MKYEKDYDNIVYVPKWTPEGDFKDVPIDNNATRNLELLGELLESTFTSLIENKEYDKVIDFLQSLHN